MNEHTEAQIAKLAVQAQFLSDVEGLRKASGNRVWALRNHFGFLSDDDVESAEAISDGLLALEEQVERDLIRALRETEFYETIKGMVGVGFKQGARLLGVIGHPCWKQHVVYEEDGETVRSRTWAPRQLSHLYSYCGYAPVEVQTYNETQPAFDRGAPENHPRSVRVAAKRQRGRQASYNSDARMRCFLIAESCIKQRHSPYREVYDRGRAKYAESVHDAPCPQCGPRGNPAKVGSPLSAGHKHARALRLVSKRVLEDLWLMSGGEEICGTLPWGHPGQPHRIRELRRLEERRRAA